MSVSAVIRQKLNRFFEPVHLEVVNESQKHNVPSGSESHFKITIVSGLFEGKSPVARHRMVNKVLAEELANQIHALSLKLLTPAFWPDGKMHHTASCLRKRESE